MTYSAREEAAQKVHDLGEKYPHLMEKSKWINSISELQLIIVTLQNIFKVKSTTSGRELPIPFLKNIKNKIDLKGNITITIW